MHVNGYLGATVEFQADISNAPVLAASLELHGTSVLTGGADVDSFGVVSMGERDVVGAGELNANGGILMTDGGQFTFKILDGRTLNNAGTAVWNAGFVIAFNGAVINNLTGATFEAKAVTI